MVVLHALANELPPGLQVPVAHPLDVGGDAQLGSHAVEVDRVLAGIDADLGRDPLAVAGREVGGDVGDLLEQVDVGRQRGQGPVEEEQVLDVEHQHLGEAGSVGEQVLDDLADLGQQLLGRHGRRVLDRLVQAEVADHGVQVGVGGQGAQVAEGGQLELGVVDGAAHQHAEEGQPAGLVQAAGDAVVEQGHRAVGPDEQVAAVKVAVEHAEEDGALEEADHQGPHHRGGVDAGRLHAGHVVEGEPAQALHDQHPPGDQVRVGSGDDHGPLVRWSPARRRCRACCRPRAGSRAPRRWSRRTTRPAPAGSPAPIPGCGR